MASNSSYLLDTSAFLWWLTNNRRLNDSLRDILHDPKNRIFVSVASGWEISIKHQAGKLPLKTTLKKCFEISGFEVLHINLDHVLELNKLPLYHKDPFDRMLVAQAKAENLTVITADPKIKKYKIKIIS